MKDRFDMENEIMKLNNFGDMLSTLSASILEDDLSHDQISTVLDGIAILLESHSNKMMDTMCQIFKLDRYNNIV